MVSCLYLPPANANISFFCDCFFHFEPNTPVHEWIPCGGAWMISEQQSCLLEAVDVLYFDINKAPDVVLNDILINKVRKHGLEKTTFGK